jgi:FKBP-type peptidyl-prolyl cis-trans isomerase 2
MARWRFPGNEDLSVGQWVRVWDRQHRRRLARLLEIGAITVIVDANHRWAGQSLELEVTVIAIRAPEVDSSADDGSEDTNSSGKTSQEKIFGSMMPAGQRRETSCP